jgi:hypothetical protein
LPVGKCLVSRRRGAAIQAPALTHIGLQNCQLDVPVCRSIVRLSKLRHLDIEGSNIDDDMIDIVSRNPTLTHLDLGNTPITARGLAYLCRMRQLELLDLWETAIGVDDLRQLEALDHLAYVSIGKVDGSVTEGVRVEGNPSVDAQAVVDLLLRMPSLKHVWLDGLRLAPAQVRALEEKLESLRL